MVFGISIDSIVAVLSLAIPAIAFAWEFVVVRRKRLGYRVQMDTLATDTAHAPGADVLARMHKNGRELQEPSFVLLRIENAGRKEIVESDYLAAEDDKTGIRVTFRQRQVVGMAVTELSQPELRDFFITHNAKGEPIETEGFGSGEEDGAGVIRLPKVKLNRKAHYKVLAVLERKTGRPGSEFPDPEFRADVSGRHDRWLGRFRSPSQLKLAATESHPFASKPALLLIGLLTAAVVIQSSVTLFFRPVPPPLDCVGGTLYLHGSTAFGPAVRRAAETYVSLCQGKGARIPIDDGTFLGSTPGLSALERAGKQAKLPGTTGLGDHIAFTDGPAEGSHPQVLSRPVAYSAYTLVVNKKAKVRNLSLAQIREIYAQKITDWSEVGGAPIPIKFVGRNRGSGTRTALVRRVLADANGRPGEVPPPTVNDCAKLTSENGSCEVESTQTLLQKVAEIDGALGYSEASSVSGAPDVVRLRIDQKQATLDGIEKGGYPYWQTEFAYTFGELPAGSIGAAFLQYLTDQGGKNILRRFGNRPCSETEYPLVCEPRDRFPG
ncbi:PstS family phosphate ABC transporter substrate-binding protein [Spongiactinospora gelatinilytica]|uniref:PstS family phosphate ABC transporter substrate-binding protein n=1 Tax=Spongiactinospora gelatinilytica TaxID=2666298 RepID=UPI0018F684DA|nr:substrate-binding domain-containing protein [Spongiactinospora gelatinilytica]